MQLHQRPHVHHAGATMLSRFLFLLHLHQLFAFESLACCIDEGQNCLQQPLLGGCVESVGSLEGTGAELLQEEASSGDRWTRGWRGVGKGLSELSWLGLLVLVLDKSPQLWCTWSGVYRSASGCSHRHPDAFPAWSGKICPPPAAGGPHSHVLLPSRPTPFWSLLLPCQGRLLTLLDDSSLHLWEIIHHNGCAHLEEGLSFQPPSRPSFDNARY